MILEFLLPIIGWLILFGVCFLIYSKFFYKESSHKVVEGQALYAVIASLFWITVYMCVSSVWSILYSLIDLKYPDVVGAAANYYSGMTSAGVVYDTFAFPLAMVVVSSITALILAFWLISRFQKNPELRPAKLYSFLRLLVYIGSAVMAFSGLVYVVYSWLYGNLPPAVFMKGGVAAVILGLVGTYFYLTGEGKNPKEAMIGRVFAGLLVILTLGTLFFSFQVIGTPAEARLYRLDSITLQNMQNVKYEIDNQNQSYGIKIKSLDEITSEYAKSALANTPMTYTLATTSYVLCANFNSDMPASINIPNRDTAWDYKAGNTCFTFKHLPTYANANSGPKAIYNQ